MKAEPAKADSAKADTAKAQNKFQVNTDKNKAGVAANTEAQMAEAKKQHPLLAMLQTTGNGSLSLVGYANVRDTAEIDQIIYSELARQIIPSDCKLLWGAKPEDGLTAKNIYGLYAIKVTSTSGRAPLEGDVVTDASDQFNHLTGAPDFYPI